MSFTPCEYRGTKNRKLVRAVMNGIRLKIGNKKGRANQCECFNQIIIEFANRSKTVPPVLVILRL